MSTYHIEIYKYQDNNHLFKDRNNLQAPHEILDAIGRMGGNLRESILDYLEEIRIEHSSEGGGSKGWDLGIDCDTKDERARVLCKIRSKFSMALGLKLFEIKTWDE